MKKMHILIFSSYPSQLRGPTRDKAWKLQHYATTSSPEHKTLSTIKVFSNGISNKVIRYCRYFSCMFYITV